MCYGHGFLQQSCACEHQEENQKSKKLTFNFSVVCFQNLFTCSPLYQINYAEEENETLIKETKMDKKEKQMSCLFCIVCPLNGQW